MSLIPRSRLVLDAETRGGRSIDCQGTVSVLLGKGAPLVLGGQGILLLEAEWKIVSYCFMWLSKFGIIMEIYYV